jgi:hypothetical protein
MNTRLEGKQILLCCGKGRCPAIQKDEESKGSDNFIITDDFGGSVKLERDQLFAIKEALERINDI